MPPELRLPETPRHLWRVEALDPENGACIIERNVEGERGAFGLVTSVYKQVLWVFTDEVAPLSDEERKRFKAWLL